MHEFFKIYPQIKVFRYVNLSNLENVLQRNLRTDRARQCIFTASGGAIFFGSAQTRWNLGGFDVCTSLSKKTLDTLLQEKIN